MNDSLVIIGGSGSLTDNKNSIGYDKIYPSLIENNIKDLELYNLSKPGNDVTEALKGLDESLHKIKPSFAIIDLGLVDCSPRVFSRKELAFLLTLPEYLQRLTYGIQKKHRRIATKIRKKVYVPLEEFEINYRKIIESCMLSCKHVWVLSITRPSDYVCNKSYRMLDHIITYNEVIRTLAHEFNCDIIDVFSGTENDVSLLANDGYHLSELGHKFIFEEFERTFIETS